MIGADKRHCILTLTERMSRFVVIQKLLARTTREVTRALTQVLHAHRRVKAITFDNGTEFHDYARIEQRFPARCSFATPYHSWERGTNENTNGLIRQYLLNSSISVRGEPRHLVEPHRSTCAGCLPWRRPARRHSMDARWSTALRC